MAIQPKSRPRVRHRMNTTTHRWTRETKPGPYKVIAVGLYEDQVDYLDETLASLRRAGWAQLNRSSLLQMFVNSARNGEIALLDGTLRLPPAAAPSRTASAAPNTAERRVVVRSN